MGVASTRVVQIDKGVQNLVPTFVEVMRNRFPFDTMDPGFAQIVVVIEPMDQGFAPIEVALRMRPIPDP